jgi:hypothetical protein
MEVSMKVVVCTSSVNYLKHVRYDNNIDKRPELIYVCMLLLLIYTSIVVKPRFIYIFSVSLCIRYMIPLVALNEGPYYLFLGYIKRRAGSFGKK